MTLRQASDAFLAVCAGIVRAREDAGCKSELWRLVGPTDSLLPEALRAEIQAEIGEMVRQGKLLWEVEDA